MDIHGLVAEVSGNSAFSKIFVRAMLDKVAAAIIKKVVAGEAVHIRGFGRFVPRKLAQRIRRNPNTGAKMLCTATTTVKFVPSAVFRDAVAAKEPKKKPAKKPAKKV